MTTPEPLDEVVLAAVAETRGGDHLADITVRPPGAPGDDNAAEDDEDADQA